MFPFKKNKRKVMMNHEEVAEKVSDDLIDLKKEYIENVLQNKKLPIVSLDSLWYTAKEHIQSSVIDKAEKELQELLKEQGRLNTDYKEYTVVKQDFLKEILILSEKAQAGDESVLESLNKVHESTLVANQKIEYIEARLDVIEDEIDAKNKEIISEMVAVGYGYIDRYKQKTEALEAEIAALRLRMLEKTQEKKESEVLLKDIYNYLHSIIGREQIEIIDKTLGSKK